MEYQIRPLQKSDNRKEFKSGQADLDHFFWRYAGQNQFRHHIGVSYIATDGDTIFGYITLAVGNLEVEKNISLGTSTVSSNITMFSPDGTEFTCGVNNSGSFLCS